jgi:hypothetical protein
MLTSGDSPTPLSIDRLETSDLLIYKTFFPREAPGRVPFFILNCPQRQPTVLPAAEFIDLFT